MSFRSPGWRASGGRHQAVWVRLLASLPGRAPAKREGRHEKPVDQILQRRFSGAPVNEENAGSFEPAVEERQSREFDLCPKRDPSGVGNDGGQSQGIKVNLVVGNYEAALVSRKSLEARRIDVDLNVQGMQEMSDQLSRCPSIPARNPRFRPQAMGAKATKRKVSGP